MGAAGGNELAAASATANHSEAVSNKKNRVQRTQFLTSIYRVPRLQIILTEFAKPLNVDIKFFTDVFLLGPFGIDEPVC